jgi:hypothetical protein
MTTNIINAPDYTELEFRIFEEDGQWVVYEAITKPFESEFAARHWLNDMRPRCIVCGSYKNSEHDRLECYCTSSKGHTFMHVSCEEKFHAWAADHHMVGPGQPTSFQAGTHPRRGTGQ